MSANGIKMEEEKMEAAKTWAEPKSIRDIQVFFGFANFYRRFIKGLSKIAAPLTSILKTTTTSPKGPPDATGNVREESGKEVGDGDRAKIGEVKPPGGKNSKNSTKVKNSAKSKVAKATSTGTAHEARLFLTPEASLAFIRLRLAFTEAPILHHFDPEPYIRMKTDESDYVIGGVLSQLTSNQRTSGLDENFSKCSDVG